MAQRTFASSTVYSASPPCDGHDQQMGAPRNFRSYAICAVRSTASSNETL